MKEILPFIQIAISILLVTVILLQQGGAAMGSAFGQGEGFHTEKRGTEKYLFHGTVVLGILFVGIAILNLFL
jgi:protein translocase SecG subunit